MEMVTAEVLSGHPSSELVSWLFDSLDHLLSYENVGEERAY